jgi:NADH-quinone oxidoreductase subunit G
MNQQEGTLTNMHKRVTPTNAGLEYHGYELNDIMREVLSAPKHTIDWTPELPTSKGFKSIEFDALPDHFENDGTEKRGYLLDVTTKEVGKIEPEKFEESTVMEGEIAYRCNPQRQFNDFTDKAHQIFEKFALYASEAKAKSLGEKVVVEFDNGNLTLDVVVDDRMEGDIVAIPDFKSAENIYELFGANRYQKVIIREV